jgi:hypothetical protein
MVCAEYEFDPGNFFLGLNPYLYYPGPLVFTEDIP